MGLASPNSNKEHYKSVEFCQFLECQAPLHNCEAPLLETFWRRFWQGCYCLFSCQLFFEALIDLADR